MYDYESRLPSVPLKGKKCMSPLSYLYNPHLDFTKLYTFGNIEHATKESTIK